SPRRSRTPRSSASVPPWAAGRGPGPHPTPPRSRPARGPGARRPAGGPGRPRSLGSGRRAGARGPSGTRRGDAAQVLAGARVDLVEELHVLLLGVDQLHLLARAERVVDHLPEPHVLELGADERATLPGLDVLELHDRVGVAIEDDAQPFPELRGGHLHLALPFPPRPRVERRLQPLARGVIVGILPED